MKLVMKFFVLLSFFSFKAFALTSLTTLTVEELRIDKAHSTMPLITKQLSTPVAQFSSQLEKARNYTALTQLVIRYGKSIWQQAVVNFEIQQNFDDRPLYWARLQMTKALRQAPAFAQLLSDQQDKLLWKFELYSRGELDIKYNKNATKKILITGFDPFFLDRNITQSNPSGVAALALDDLFISSGKNSAEIETLMIPVRFADFDRGIIEELLTPYLKKHKIDMLITISMGRENFDLERFPALRRSAKAPDNLNVYTGANKNNPLIPNLRTQTLQGNEFVEFSLPAKKMQQALGMYKINLNAKVTTLNEGKMKTFKANTLAEIKHKTSVQGSGGGYLSNEISYRSILLRNQYAPMLPVGHIHTPKVNTFNTKTNQAIVKQIKAMVTLALDDI